MDRGIVPSDIYKILAAPSYNYNISMYDYEGIGTISPIQAKWFYVKPVNFMIQVPNGTDNLIRPEVYLWKSHDIKDEQTKEILNRLKNCCNQYGYGFTVNDFGNGNLPKKFSHMAMRDVEETKLNESLEGSAFRSYYKLPKAKTIIIHSSRINEDSDRTDNIKEIFIDCLGERLKLKVPNIAAAKAITLHMNESGSWNDKYSTFIQNSSEDLLNLQEMLSTVQNKVLQRKCEAFITELQDALNNSSTPNGYSADIADLRYIPRIGKKYVSAFSKKLDPSLSPKGSEALARQYLIRECKNLSKYSRVIYDNLNDKKMISTKDIVKLAKKVCLGCMDVDPSIPFQYTKSVDPKEKVLLFGTQIASVLKDNIIKEVLNNICSKPYLDESDAKFIAAVGNSVIGTYKK